MLEETAMPNYRITIRREIEQTHDREIEADNEDDARDQAGEEIDNISEDDWSDGATTADAEVTNVTELTENGEEDEVEDEDEEPLK
jgi:hypothetical protein